MFDLNRLIRDNIKTLTPYSSARDEFKGDAAVFLDANENPFNDPVNRYPDPLQWKLKQQIAKIKNTSPENIFLGNGSDEAIDLIIRVFCEPGIHNIVAIDPTYGMYKVCADINHVEYRRVPLTPDFEIDTEAMLAKTDDNTRLIFICSPNNPTSNSFKSNDIKKIINTFNGIIVLDEAYIDFSSEKGFLHFLPEYPNLIILQTFSKAWGMAGIRLGMAFAGNNIIATLNKIKYPYNVNVLTMETAMKSLHNIKRKERWVAEIIYQRSILTKELEKIPVVLKIFPSDANFLLVKVEHPREIYDYLVKNNIVVRDRSKVSLCEGCLRITVGTANENNRLIKVLTKYQE
jgi:histidinol-phosphate aminotransferase